jgi:tRNA 2-thiocytidine biosynthesis protein TtcA
MLALSLVAVSALAPAAPKTSVPAVGQPLDLEWKLLKSLRRCSRDFELIQPGDRIAVAVSGGKDSNALVYLLQQMKRRRLLPFDDWEFVAVHLDQVQPGHDPAPLADWLEDEGVRLELLREDTYTVVTEKTAPGRSYCSLCSRLRRGILYTAALDLGCNRLALGHHRDDALETLMMNMVRRPPAPPRSACALTVARAAPG